MNGAAGTKTSPSRTLWVAEVGRTEGQRTDNRSTCIAHRTPLDKRRRTISSGASVQNLCNRRESRTVIDTANGAIDKIWEMTARMKRQLCAAQCVDHDTASGPNDEPQKEWFYGWKYIDFLLAPRITKTNVSKIKEPSLNPKERNIVIAEYACGWGLRQSETTYASRTIPNGIESKCRRPRN